MHPLTSLLAVPLIVAAASLSERKQNLERPTRACETLAQTSLPNTTISSATALTSGSFTPPGATTAISQLPGFCRVVGMIAPTRESQILFEVWLPLEGWNGKFAGVGNGGFAGTVSYGALATQVRAGYAAASTNTGHVAAPAMDGARFGYDHPEQLVDFAHRAIHEMTVQGKALMHAFYDRDAAHSYFIGCSTGGRQALMEAQRYPDDYDGIVAGAPASNLNGLEAWSLDALLAMNAEPGSYLTAQAAALLNRAVLEKCDMLDGTRDSLIVAPNRCDFDPGSLQCAAGQSDGCLSAAQVVAVRRVYAGLTNPRTGARIYPGLVRGSEVAWTDPLNPAQPFPIPIAHFKWLVLRDSTWDWKKFDFTKAADLDRYLAFDRSIGPVINAFDPDLSAFRKRGGKLIQYHGWGDPLISPLNSINYHDLVAEKFGDAVNSFYRLFMVPGMGHCGGGPGPNVFDMRAALEAWVEQDKAPESVIAVHRTNGQQDRSRPLCVYPSVSVYKGRGDTADAANFECR